MKATVFIVTILVLIISIFNFFTNGEEIPDIISNEVKSLETLNKQPSRKLIKAIHDFKKIKNKAQWTDTFCHSCHLVIGQIITYRQSGASRDSMINFFKKLCSIFTTWGSVACDGYIAIEIDTVLYIIDNKSDLRAEKLCAILFQHKGCTDAEELKWTVEIPPRRNSTHGINPENTTQSPWKLLHLTDFHYDPLYQPGNNAACDVPLCCQKSNGPPSDPKYAAGYWGDYRVCDTPWHSITDFMHHVTTQHTKIDFVYYTGDIISHKSWATNKADNSKAIKDLFDVFKDGFGETPVYPVLGNHEPHPTDFYSPKNVNGSRISTHWVFDLVATEWSKWLPEDTQITIKTGGYYTVLVRPGFRIVALNSNVCYTGNLWLLYEDEDPYDQLKWLVKVLTEAEKKGEKVHILSHIPPGDRQCLQQWTSQFRKIVNRFAPIISAHFNGHTHYDELRLFYDANEVNSVAYNAGSFTTFVAFNPNYRIYDVDPKNYTVLDYDHYIYNLTEANQSPGKSPRWYKLYSFKAAFGLPDTTFASLAQLVENMSKNQTLVKKYYKHLVRDSDPLMAQGCNEACLEGLLCSITAVEAADAIKCQQS